MNLDPAHILRNYLLSSPPLQPIVSDRIFYGRLPGGPELAPCIWFTQEGGLQWDVANLAWARMHIRCVGKATEGGDDAMVVAQRLVEALRSDLHQGQAYSVRSPGLFDAKQVAGPMSVAQYANEPQIRELEALLVVYQCHVEAGRPV